MNWNYLFQSIILFTKGFNVNLILNIQVQGGSHIYPPIYFPYFELS